MFVRKQAIVSVAIALVSQRGLPRTTAFLRPSSVSVCTRGGGTSCVMSSTLDGQTGSRGQIVLGSKSFTRKMIVEEMGFIPIVRSADIDEASIGDRTADPIDLVLQLGLAKAEELLPTLRAEAESGTLGATLLLTGDQVVVHDGRVLEKPADEEEVRRNIASYARSPCRTVGSAVLTDVVTGRQFSGVDTAEIFFSEIPDSVVKELCSEGTVLHCAGGLMVEHTLVQPYITKIEGSIDSVMGLSKALVLKLLQQLKDSS